MKFRYYVKGFAAAAAAACLIGLAGHGVAGASAAPASQLTPGPELTVTVGQQGPAFEKQQGGVVSSTGMAWGYNLQGQLGDGTKTNRLQPVQVNGGTLLDAVTVSFIDPGQNFSCGIAEGRAYCWGKNEFGQLGNGTTVDSASPVLVGGALSGKTVTAISAGYNHACAVANGKAYCWGGNAIGKIGTNWLAPNKELSPVAVYDGGAIAGKVVTAVSVGKLHTCIIASAKVYCWGGDGSGQLGTSAEEMQQGSYTSYKPIPPDAGDLGSKSVTSVAVGEEHTCVVAESRVYCWGENGSGQLGTGDTTDRVKPTAVSTSGELKNLGVFAISSAGATTCVIAGDGLYRHPFCWGAGNTFQLGNGSNQKSTVPAKVLTGIDLAGKVLSSISVGSAGGCLAADGAAYCWGSNTSGRLGNNTTTLSKIPTPVTKTGVMSGKYVLSVNAGNGGFTAAIGGLQTNFNDLKDNPFRSDVGWLSAAQITTGYEGNLFKPTLSTSRQAMASFLYRLLNPGIKKPACTGTYFLDVGKNHPFCGEIEWLAKAKIVDAANHFWPSDPMSRGFMAIWLYRAHHPGVALETCGGQSRFNDVAANSPFCGSIEWLADTGVTTGNADGSFGWDKSVTRQAMSAFFHRFGDLRAH